MKVMKYVERFWTTVFFIIGAVVLLVAEIITLPSSSFYFEEKWQNIWGMLKESWR